MNDMLGIAGDAERLQMAEVQLLGSSSVGTPSADGSLGAALLFKHTRFD